MNRNLYLKPHELPQIESELCREVKFRLQSSGLGWSPGVSRSIETRVHRWLDHILLRSHTREQFEDHIDILKEEIDKYVVALEKLNLLSSEAHLLSPAVFRKVIWRQGRRISHLSKGADITDNELRELIGSTFTELDREYEQLPEMKCGQRGEPTTDLLSSALKFICCVLGLDFEFLCARIKCP